MWKKNWSPIEFADRSSVVEKLDGEWDHWHYLTALKNLLLGNFMEETLGGEPLHLYNTFYNLLYLTTWEVWQLLCNKGLCIKEQCNTDQIISFSVSLLLPVMGIDSCKKVSFIILKFSPPYFK